jgi:hypothetical protein
VRRVTGELCSVSTMRLSSVPWSAAPQLARGCG